MKVNYTKNIIVYSISFDENASYFYQRYFEVLDLNQLVHVKKTHSRVISKKIEINNKNFLTMKMVVETSLSDNKVEDPLNELKAGFDSFFQTIAKHFIYPIKFSKLNHLPPSVTDNRRNELL